MTEKLTSSYWNKKQVSRRQLMRGAALGGAGLAGAALIGCSSDDGGSTKVSGNKGGTLISAPDIELATTDPAFFPVTLKPQLVGKLERTLSLNSMI